MELRGASPLKCQGAGRYTAKWAAPVNHAKKTGKNRAGKTSAAKKKGKGRIIVGFIVKMGPEGIGACGGRR